MNYYIYKNSANSLCYKAGETGSENVILNTVMLTNLFINSNCRFVISSVINLYDFVPTSPYVLIIGSNTIIEFVGGRIICESNNAIKTVQFQGNSTVIHAPAVEIFGKSIELVGTWDVLEWYPEWFHCDNNDDATRINKAINLTKIKSGIVKLTGSYTIQSTIKVPIGVCLEGCNPYLTQIIVGGNFAGDEITMTDEERQSTYSKYEQALITLSSAVSFTPQTSIRPAILFTNEGTIYSNNRGCCAKNFTIKCNNRQCDGIVVNNAYDQSSWENIQVEDVHLIRSAFVFRRYPGNVGQTVLIKNCIGSKHKYAAGNYDDAISIHPAGEETESIPSAYVNHCFHNGIPSAPVFKFYRMNESTLIGCKGFSFTPSTLDETFQSLLDADLIALYRNEKRPPTGTTDAQILVMPEYKEYRKETTYRLLGGTSFEFMDSQGITMEGCSIADALTGVLINAKNKNASGFTISGLTSEKLRSYDVFTDYSPDKTVNEICILPIRKLNTTSGIMLNRCTMGFIVTLREQDIALKSGHHNIIFSVREVNTLIGDDNAVEKIRDTLMGSTNILVPSFFSNNVSSLNVAEGLVIRGAFDNGHTVPSYSQDRVNSTLGMYALTGGGSININSKERIMINGTPTDDSIVINDSSEQQLMAVKTATIPDSAPSGAGGTSLQLQVKVGNTMMFLPVEISQADANGYCTLRVKINNN